MASELSNQVYTAPQAPDYLGHYAELMRSIPDYGKQFAQAQIQQAQLEQAQAQYEMMKQKAKAFTELYPAWKAAEMDKYRAQAEKLREEAKMFPYRSALLQEQTALAKARTGSLNPPTDGSDPLSGIARSSRPGSKGGPVQPFRLGVDPLQPATPAAPVPPPLAVIPESDTPPTAISVPRNPDEEYFASR